MDSPPAPAAQRRWWPALQFGAKYGKEYVTDAANDVKSHNWLVNETLRNCLTVRGGWPVRGGGPGGQSGACLLRPWCQPSSRGH